MTLQVPQLVPEQQLPVGHQGMERLLADTANLVAVWIFLHSFIDVICILTVTRMILAFMRCFYTKHGCC